MNNVVRSELVRLRRRAVVIGWFGLIAAFAVLINIVMFQFVEPGAAEPAPGPGVTFPSSAELMSSSGLFAGMPAAATFFGIVTLSFWALATATDYDTGLVRIIVSAQPSRWRLVLGKWVALAVMTALSAAIALIISVGVAPLGASAGGWEPTAWGEDGLATAASTYLELLAALLVWGSIGQVLATLFRSSGIAIGVGIAYVMVVEGVIGAASSAVGDWLPGATLSALAAGGNATMELPVALGLGLAYTVAAIGGACWAFTTRDITD
ncbi:MAG: hypothetical protein WBG36_12230 [Ornithinimicrobium sp.]